MFTIMNHNEVDHELSFSHLYYSAHIKYNNYHIGLSD